MAIARSNNYLSTGEVQSFVNTTRRKLAECASKGVVHPFSASEQDGADRRWTLTQAQAMCYIPEFKRNGMAFEDIASLAQEGHAAFCQQLSDFHMRELRSTRRSSRCMVRYQHEQAETANLTGISGYYLRYLPQRYFALAPALTKDEFPGGSAYMRLLIQIMNVSQAVGWSPVSLTGSIASFSSNGRVPSIYTYSELAIRPEPVLSAYSDVDSGCYCSVSDACSKVPCDKNCSACMRFGRMPSDAELFAWGTRERTQPNLFDLTVMAKSLKEPYPSGAWSYYTHAVCGANDTGLPGLGDECSIVPRLMPHEVRLPYGVTACVMPAGVYLCCQHGEQDQAHAFEHTMGLASALPRRNIGIEDELAAHAALCERMAGVLECAAQRADCSPFPPVIGNPDAAGWNRKVSIEDLPNLTLLTNMAFAPEDGCCVVCAEMPPLATSDAPRFETQILIDASKIASLHS